MIDDTGGDLTPKARQTRERIVETALALFARDGYQETTLRAIAAEAGISLGLTYRYFARKEELIFVLYQQLAYDLKAEADTLPAAPLAQRFGQTIGSCLTRLAPHREALAALFAVGLAPNSEMAVLGDKASGVRDVVWHVYLAVVMGATDKPRPRQAAQFATLFYALHLMFVLFWLQDRSPGQQSTGELISFTQDTLARLRPALGLPPVAKTLSRLVRIIDPLFRPPV